MILIDLPLTPASNKQLVKKFKKNLSPEMFRFLIAIIQLSLGSLIK